MSQSSSRLNSMRAIEDIIQIQKYHDKLPKFIESQILKEEIEDTNCTFNKHNSAYISAENHIKLPKTIEGNIVKHIDIKLSKAVEGNGSEGDYQNAEFIQSENVKIIDKTDSEFELRSWPSDSDITILRMKREFRKELSTRISWEEERNLTDNSSSENLDCEDHSLINLANTTVKKKDDTEQLKPFTIWSKSKNYQKRSKELHKKSDLFGMRPLLSRVSFTGQSKSLPDLNHPSDEFTFYVSVHVEQQKPNGELLCESKNQIIPVFQEKIDVLHRIVPTASLNENVIHKKTDKITDLSSSVNKNFQSKKLKLLRNFFNFFGKCGSKKNFLDNND